MKTAEEYIRFNKSIYTTIEDIATELSCDEIINIIELAQKEAYNQAIKDASENARTTTNSESTSIIVDKQTILKLKQ